MYWTMNDDSDHHSFFAAGVPVMMFHTGLHEDYHTPFDTADKLDFEKTGRVVRGLRHVIRGLINPTE